jgi:flagellar biosynthesis protein FliP
MLKTLSPRSRLIVALLAAAALGLLLAAPAFGAPSPTPVKPTDPALQVPLPGANQDPGTNLSILALFTLITLGPSLLIMMTGFTRILIVLGFLRNALGTPQIPPNQVLVGFSLFLTLFVMGPTFGQINKQALQPYLNKQIDAKTAIQRAEDPLRSFMLKQTGKSELALFVRLSREPPPKTAEDVPMTTLIPAFMISEIKTAFQIGFLIYIPFLIIDMVVASTLMSMGMMMLPPAMISLPFKLLLFVLVDGWALLSQNLVAGFHV